MFSIIEFSYYTTYLNDYRKQPSVVNVAGVVYSFNYQRKVLHIMAIATTVHRSAEFQLTHKDVDYVAYPAWEENGGDIFNIVLAETNEFVDSMFVSPHDEVHEAFALWTKTRS